MLFGKDKLNTIEVLIYKAFMDSYINDEFVSVNNVLREHYEMNKEKKPWISCGIYNI